MPIFSFTGRLTVEDFKDFYRFHANHAPMGKKLVRLWRVLALIFPFTFFALSFILSEGEVWEVVTNPVYLGVCAALTLAFFLFAKKICISLTFLSIRQLKKRPVNPLENDALFRFFDDYYMETCSHLETKFDYAVMEKIYADKGAFYISLKNQTNYLLFPYRFFSSETEKASFLNFIQQK